MEEKEQPILSILIPTYNGASKYIVDVLDFVVKGISLCDSGEIEVVVSNNASTDDTEEFLKRFETYPFFRHYLNRENIGFARNIILLTDTYARGKYGWVIGDDDLIAPQSIPFIINTLKSGNVDYLSLGFKFINDIIEFNSNESYSYRVNKCSFAESLDHSQKGNILGTFMSSAVFNVSIFRSVNKDSVTDSFNTVQSIFPNGFLNATAFHDKKCGFILDPVVYPLVHQKDWATSDNDYMIRTRIIPTFYNYIISLGVNKGDLSKTCNRMYHDAVITGYGRLLRGKKVDKAFVSVWARSFLHPTSHIQIVNTIIGKILRRIKRMFSKVN